MDVEESSRLGREHNLYRLGLPFVFHGKSKFSPSYTASVVYRRIQDLLFCLELANCRKSFYKTVMLLRNDCLSQTDFRLPHHLNNAALLTG